MKIWKTKLLMLLAVMLCMVVFCVPALASGADDELLTVNAAWVDGDMLRINVTDAEGVTSALALRLADYVDNAENKEYIAIQAVDLAGNKSEIIEIKNPFYIPPSVPPISVIPGNTQNPTSPPQSESSISNGGKPFTPDGTGTVLDNATDGDGKEFFTITTEDDNVFYLIVDRQRTSDNVYLLNAVTEEDLMALAEKGGRTIDNNVSAIPTPSQTGTTEGEENPTASSPPGEDNPPSKNNNGSLILIIIAVLGVGGAGYYFKIVKGKKNAPADEDDWGDDDNSDDNDSDTDDEDDDLGDDTEDGGEEE